MVDKKYKIGYTSGVFDLFHIGHLNILRKAKEQCDFLIVAVSADELVQTYKNKVPVIPFEERAAIISSIKYVDKVVAQNDRDKISAFTKYNFDVMFVGDDWKGDPLWVKLEKELNSKGSEIIYFEYTKHISSTLLKQVLNQSKEK